MTNVKKFWEVRAEQYNELQWANEKTYLDALIKAGDFKSDQLVLDVGTGTGIVLHEIAPLVDEIIGLDISQAMLDHSNWQGNKFFVRRDISDPFFHEGVFDRVTARMVFHHIIDKTQDAANEVYRILKPGGKFLLSEGVPPTSEVKDDYEKIFALKEERLTFMPEDLIGLLENAGFKNIQPYTYIMKEMSVNNWLEKSGLEQEIQDEILEMHINAPAYFKEAYNMKISRGACLIDIKYAILVGEK
ncbi:class I SAM-dependent methyltransferase [bacterium]|nr:class I SAM-dependent methyltransferase [bacterium]